MEGGRSFTRTRRALPLSEFGGCLRWGVENGDELRSNGEGGLRGPFDGGDQRWESWPGRPQPLHRRVRRDYVLAFGSFFQRMGATRRSVMEIGTF
jgi:hypothetical protein